MLIPVLPTIQTQYGISHVQVSYLITMFSIAAGIIIPIAGVFADRVGRKKVITMGLILYGIGGLLGGIAAVWFSGSYIFLLGARIVQGIGAAGTAPIAMVLVSDLYQKSARSEALGMIEASNAMGKVLSPILGSLLALITWYAMFFAFPVLCIPIAILLYLYIPEPKKQQKTPPLKGYLQQIKKIFIREGRWLFLAFLLGSFSLFTTFGVLFRLSDLLENTYHIVGVKKGGILAIPLLALCITAYVTGKNIKDRIGMMKTLILVGLGIMAIFVAFLPWVKSAIFLILILSIVSVGSGLILPSLNTLITSATGIAERGMITSLYGSVRFFGVAFGPTVYGALANKPFWLFLGSSALLIIFFVLTFFLVHRPQRLRGKDDHHRILIRKKRFHPV